MFWDDVYKFQLKRTGNEIEAEDITIESFAKAFHKINSYNDNYVFKTWLITISKSEGLPSIKQKKNNIKNELLETAKKDFIYQNVMETFSDAELIDIKNDIEDNG